MSPIGSGEVSLTKHYRLDALVNELAQVKPGMTYNQVRSVLTAGGHAHAELADDLVTYDDGRVVDDEMLRACRAGRHDARHLVWVALVLADPRLARTVEELLTDANGRLVPAHVNGDYLRPALGRFVSTNPDKATSNVLRYLETAELIVGRKHNKTIIGIERLLPTSHAVPGVVSYLEERLEEREVLVGPAADAVDLALALGANHWLNLTPAQFRAAARGTATAPTRNRRPLPEGLAELDVELRRKRQVILQGPPGSGKTYIAREYIQWAAAGDSDEARLSSVLARIPTHERTTERVVDEAVATGAACIWDIVQFHPSYTYEDFVRGLQAEPVEGGVTFTARNKLLGLAADVAAELARRESVLDVILVIDEINRGDISKIFGELIYALEYRNEPVASPYDIAGTSTVMIPGNLLLLGTMNTADRSIAVVDYALRRRFVFVDVLPRRSVLEGATTFAGANDRAAALRLYDAVSELFEDEEVPELRDLQVGHSYFLLERTPADEATGIHQLARRFAYEVYPLLMEYEAEGRFASGKMAALLATFGIDGRPRQAELAVQLEQVLAAEVAP
jgi:5-methylcytosine-specific restriction protein B